MTKYILAKFSIAAPTLHGHDWRFSLNEENSTLNELEQDFQQQ
jgi:hypothetical protein